MPPGFTGVTTTSGTGIALPFADTNYLGNDFYLKYPDLLKNVVTSWDNQGFADLLNFNKQVMVTNNEVISNYEQGPLFRSVALASVTGGSATAATVTLSNDSYTTVGSLQGNVARSPLMERNILRLPNGVEVRVQSKSSVNGGLNTTYTWTTSTNAPAGFNLGTYLTGAFGTAPTQRYAIVSTSSAERSTEPLEGLESPLTRYANELQIFRTHSEITGSAAGDRFEIDLTGGAGSSVGLQDGHYWSSKQRLEHGISHNTWMGMQYMFGKGGRFVDADGLTQVKTTLGMEGYVRSYGNTYEYTNAAFTLTDLNALVARINFMQGPREYMWIMGYGLYAQVQTVLTQLVGNAGAVRYDQFGNGDPRKKFVSLGFNGFNYAGINFHLQQSPTFSHPEMLGLAGYNYIDQGVLIPYVKTEVTSYDNGIMERIALDSVMLRYKMDLNNVSRRLREYDRGITIHGIDKTNHEKLSHEGLQMVKLRCFVWCQRATA